MAITIQAKIAALQTDIELCTQQTQGLISQMWTTLSDIEEGSVALGKDRKEHDAAMAALEVAEKARFAYLQTQLDAATIKLKTLNALTGDKAKVQALATTKEYEQVKKLVFIYANQEARHCHFHTSYRYSYPVTFKLVESYGSDPAHHCLHNNPEFQHYLGITTDNEFIAKMMGFIKRPSSKGLYVKA